MAFGILSMLVSLLLPILVIAGIVAAIANSRRGDPEEDVAPGIGTVRRVFLYGLALVALIFAAVGVSMLLEGALKAFAGDLVIAGSDTELAIALAFTVVGTPAWLFFAWLAQRSIAQHPVEHRSQARRLYFALVRAIALSVAMVSGVMVLRFVVGLDDFDGGPWGWLVAWSAVWMLHHRLAAAEPAPTVTTRLIDRLYLYFGALAGLYTFGGGLIYTLRAPLTGAYEDLVGVSVISQRAWHEDLRAAAVVALVGVVVWGWHWLRTLARGDAGTTLWYVYLFIFGVAAAVWMTIGATANLLFTVLQWWIGEPGARTAAEHFDSLPGITSVLAVGALAWGYHRAVLRERTPVEAPWTEPERVYRYLVAGAGLLALAAGITALLAVVFDSLAPAAADLVQRRWWRNPLAFGITMVLVGAPVWARYWFQAQRESVERGDAERSAPSRRVFVFAVFGAAALTTLIDMTVILFGFFEGLLEGTLSAEFLRENRWSLAIVLVAAAVGVYYWLVLREDQRLAPAAQAAPTVRPREVVVLAGQPEALVRALSTEPGVRVRAWRRLDAPAAVPLDPARLEALLARVRTAEGGRFLLVARGDEYDLVPYEAV